MASKPIHLGVVMEHRARTFDPIFAGVREHLDGRRDVTLSVFRNMPVSDVLAEDVAGAGVDGVVLTAMSHPNLPLYHGALRARSIPFVQTLLDPRKPGVDVTLDYAAMLRAGLDHLAEQNFTRVIYFDAGDSNQAHRLRPIVQAAVAERPEALTYFMVGPRTKRLGRWRLTDQLADLADLLNAADGPVGVLAADDTHAERAVRAARLAGRRVPEDTAVVGIGDDMLFCEYATPPLSSVALDYAAMGQAATALLLRLIAGQPRPRKRVAVPPAGVSVRQSSDHTAVDDADVNACLRYIRDHVDRPITVDDLATHTSLSRSTITRRFQATLGRPPSAEITRLRIDHARMLLRQTTWGLAHVADACGFGHLSQFSHVFKRETGLTPSRYRRNAGDT